MAGPRPTTIGRAITSPADVCRPVTARPVPLPPDSQSRRRGRKAIADRFARVGANSEPIDAALALRGKADDSLRTLARRRDGAGSRPTQRGWRGCCSASLSWTDYDFTVDLMREKAARLTACRCVKFPQSLPERSTRSISRLSRDRPATGMSGSSLEIGRSAGSMEQVSAA